MVELTHADGKIEALLESLSYARAGDGRVGLTVLDQQGKHLPTQFGRVPIPSVSKSLLAVVLHTFEQAIDGRTVHRGRAVHSRDFRRCSLLSLPDDLTLACLALLWGNGCLHGEAFFSFFVTLMGFFLVYHHLSMLSRCSALCFTVTPC